MTNQPLFFLLSASRSFHLTIFQGDSHHHYSTPPCLEHYHHYSPPPHSLLPTKNTWVFYRLWNEPCVGILLQVQPFYVTPSMDSMNETISVCIHIFRLQQRETVTNITTNILSSSSQIPPNPCIPLELRGKTAATHHRTSSCESLTSLIPVRPHNRNHLAHKQHFHQSSQFLGWLPSWPSG